MPTNKQLEMLHAAIAPAAVKAEQETGLPAELSAAQCILESAWLENAPCNNAFGIKATRRHSKTQVIVTTEYAQGEMVRAPLLFAAFSNIAASFEDYARLVTTAGAYRKAWSQYQVDRDLDALVVGVAHTYATDPAYAEKVLALVHSESVRAAVAEARVVAEAEARAAAEAEARQAAAQPVA